MYPSIIVQNGYYPEHLGRFFLQLYSYFLNTRLKEKQKPKKERNAVIMEGYKLFVNGLYGKFNSETSPFYDPLVAMSTTITGQLSLSMLMEMLTLEIPEIQWIQANTDGITARVPRKFEQLFYDISKEWEKITKLELEFAKYTKMAVQDVSNYLAVYDYGDVKLKGCFEIDKELHKDPGMRIVPIALKNYFVNKTPIEETIKNHKDIFDFCMELKVNSDWQSVYEYINTKTSQLETQDLGKITRYFISGSNGNLAKRHKTDGRVTNVFKEFGVKIFNRAYKLEEFKDYNINYNFYIREARKIINKIEDNQLKLFS